MIRPGQPPLTIERETVLRNGQGQASVRVRRGDRLVSNVTESLKSTTRKKVSKRRYVRGLYKKAERKTMKRLRGRDL